MPSSRPPPHPQLIGMTIFILGMAVAGGVWRVIADHASPNAVILPAAVMPVLVAALARRSRSR